eukprot:5084481-Ditylum_brightwellii.AAC.1
MMLLLPSYTGDIKYLAARNHQDLPPLVMARYQKYAHVSQRNADCAYLPWGILTYLKLSSVTLE